MPDQPTQPPGDRFKAEMPQIPGVEPSKPKSRGLGGPLLVSAGLIAVLVAVFVGGKMLSKSSRPAVPAPVPQIDVPAPIPDLSAALPPAVEQNAPIAQVGELAKPWDSVPFAFHNRTTGEHVDAILIRLPTGSASSPSGYWSVAMKAAFGNCRLDYMQDLKKLKSDYGYTQAKHPMLANPCSRTLFDPLKFAPISGNVLARGAIVQGSDLRPPLAIEIKLQGKNILATRME
jgi:hypothetical protein